jgi:hypothetical protein
LLKLNVVSIRIIKKRENSKIVSLCISGTMLDRGILNFEGEKNTCPYAILLSVTPHGLLWD